MPWRHAIYLLNLKWFWRVFYFIAQINHLLGSGFHTHKYINCTFMLFCSFKHAYIGLQNFFQLIQKQAPGLMDATLLKKRPWHKRLPVNFAKFLRASFLQNTSAWLLLSIATLLVQELPLQSLNCSWDHQKCQILRLRFTLVSFSLFPLRVPVRTSLFIFSLMYCKLKTVFLLSEGLVEIYYGIARKGFG